MAILIPCWVKVATVFDKFWGIDLGAVLSQTADVAPRRLAKEVADPDKILPRMSDLPNTLKSDRAYMDITLL